MGVLGVIYTGAFVLGGAYYIGVVLICVVFAIMGANIDRTIARCIVRRFDYYYLSGCLFIALVMETVIYWDAYFSNVYLILQFVTCFILTSLAYLVDALVLWSSSHKIALYSLALIYYATVTIAYHVENLDSTSDYSFCWLYCTTAKRVFIANNTPLLAFIARFLAHSIVHKGRLVMLSTLLEPNIRHATKATRLLRASILHTHMTEQRIHSCS